MKSSYLILFFLFSFCVGFAQTQDTVSLEEQQRREKNIQAGNPFKKFGYKPKISTLSKGKYLENHDLDSIVQIGSFTFHVKKKIITGYIVKETKYSEATLQPEIISRWFSPDPLAEEFTDWSPYTFTNDNPILYLDPDGRYAVSVHFRMTYKTMIRLGYNKAEATKIAQYSSVYADHPSPHVLSADNNLNMAYNTYHKVSGIDYSPTKDSQAEKNSKWHSMMSDQEASEGMTHKESLGRGLSFGWDNIFSQKDGEDLGKLGQGLHALQDAYAHKGASTNEHLGSNLSSAKMVINDMYGSTDDAQLITKSAGIVLQLFNSNTSNVKNGMSLDFSGMSNKQLKNVTNLFKDAGFNLNSGNKEGYYTISRIK